MSNSSRSLATRRSLISIGLAAAIPVVIFAAWVTFINARQERSNARLNAAQTLNRVVTRLSDELRAQVEVAEILATSPALDKADLPLFYEEARRLKNARPLWQTVALLDIGGQQLLNLLRPMGAELGSTTDRDNFDLVVQSRKPVMGGIGPVGPLSGRRLVPLRVPVEREGAIKFVLTVALVPEAISLILRNAGAPQTWVGAVVDARGNIVARTVDERFEIGRPESQSVRDAISRASSGSYVGRTLEGVEVEAIYQSLPGLSGWSVHFGMPTDDLNKEVIRSNVFLVASGMASLLLGFALAWLSARDITQRRRDQEAQAALELNLSEERRALAVNAADLGVFSWDPKVRLIRSTKRTRELLDIISEKSGDVLIEMDSFLARIHVPDRKQVLEVLFGLRPDELTVLEFRILNGNWRRLSGRGSMMASGVTLDGVLLDISMAKQVEVERIHLLRRLSEAQENERRRISRELHDQIGQVVTGLMLGLKSVEQSIRGTNHVRDHETIEKLHWLQKLTDTIGRDIHQVAADLRPAALDDLGVARALEAFCSEWSVRFDIRIDLQALGSQTRLPTEIEIAIYRIVQEALNNVLKHANATNVSVVLDRRADDYRIIVEDDGVGIPSSSATQIGAPAGLGLSGIRERLTLLGGTLSIESGQNAGTTLFIVIPLTTRADDEANSRNAVG